MSVGETYVTVQGRVGSDVQFKEAAGSKVALASFRLGSTPRFYDRGEGQWADRPTTWFTVECWRTLAENVKASLVRGQPVTVTGRLKTTEWVDQGVQRSRTVLDAFSVGHDLTRGTAAFRKNPPQERALASVSADEEMRGLSDLVETNASVGEESPFGAEEIAAAADLIPVGGTGSRPDSGSDSESGGGSGSESGGGSEQEVGAGRARRAA
jgi:single-strand DNA-binding protein